MGVAWLTEFLSDCIGCTISAVAAHWCVAAFFPVLKLGVTDVIDWSRYDSATNTAYFTNYLTDLHNTTGKPIWLTEVRLPLPRLYVTPALTPLQVHGQRNSGRAADFP